MKKKVAWVSQWPVHYHVPIYKELNKLKNIDFNVIFCDDITLKGYFDRESQSIVGWKSSILLSGYKYNFLKNITSHNNDRSFFTLVNFSIIKHLLIKKYDVVIITGYMDITFILAVIVSKIVRSKIIFKGESTLREKKDSLIKTNYLKIFFKFFDLIFYSCKGNYNFLKQYSSPKNFFYAPCVVDNNFYRKGYLSLKSNRSEIRKEMGINDNEIVLLSVGKLYKRKRPLDILKAMKSLKTLNCCALLVGNGEQKNEIKEYSKRHNLKTILPGHKSSDEVIKYFIAADIYLQLSDYDPSPKSLNEAMNFSLPLIVSKTIGTCDDLVFENRNGYKVDKGDISKIADSIKKLEFSDLRTKLGEESEKIVRNFSIEDHVSRMNEAIKVL